MKIKHVEVTSDGVVSRINNTYAEDVDVRFAHTRALMTRISRAQLYALAVRGMVNGWAYGDKLCYAILTVPPQHARRVLRLAPAEDAGHRASHRKQSPGAKRWVPRPDRAKTGRSGAQRQVWSGRIQQQVKAIICGEEML